MKSLGARRRVGCAEGWDEHAEGERRYSPIQPIMLHMPPTFPSTGVEKVWVQTVVFIETLQLCSCFGFWQVSMGAQGWRLGGGTRVVVGQQ